MIQAAYPGWVWGPGTRYRYWPAQGLFQGAFFSLPESRMSELDGDDDDDGSTGSEDLSSIGALFNEPDPHHGACIPLAYIRTYM